MPSFPDKPHVLATEVTMGERSAILKACDGLFEVKIIPGTLAEATSEDKARVEILMPFIHSTIGRAEIEVDPLLVGTQTWKLSPWRCIKKMK